MALQIRRGTDAEWEAGKQNIVAGEPAIALDTRRVFVGTANGQYVELANKDSVDPIADRMGLRVITDYTIGERAKVVEGVVTTVSAPAYKYAKISCAEGDKFTMSIDYAIASNFFFADINNNVIPVQVSGTDNVVLTAPADSAYVYINNKVENSYTDYYGDWGETVAERLANPEITDGSVTTPKLADGAVTTPKLADSSVTTAKLNGVIDTTLTVSGKAADSKAVGDALAEKADTNGSYDSMTVGTAKQLLSDTYVENKVPYIFRASGGSLEIGDREQDTLVGMDLVWNQYVDTNSASVTIPSGHVYYANINNVKTIGISDGTAIAIDDGTKDNVIDLTATFGSSIANYIANLGSTNGVAWVKRYLTKDYYPYSAPTLQNGVASSHEMVGFNQFDNSTVVDGKYIDNDGTEKTSPGKALSDYIKVFPNTVYYVSDIAIISSTNLFCNYDADKNLVGFSPSYNGNGRLRQTFSNAEYIRINMVHDAVDTLNVNIHYDGERDGEYEPYVKHSYPLDATVDLHGIPKIDASGNLYADGDTYEADGTVTRTYRKKDLGTLTYSYNGGVGGVYEFIASVSDKKVGSANILCEGFVYVQGSYANGTIDVRLNSNRIVLHSNLTDDPTTFKNLLSGKYLTYELATPTTESAEPFQTPQIVDNWGTEEYVTDGVIPIGHSTKYFEDLRGKIEDLPSLPTSNGEYKLKITDGVATWVSV